LKLTISNIFDYATIAATKAAQEIKPFIDHYNASIDQIVKAIKGQLTLADNFYGQQLVVELVHNVQTKVAITRPQVLGIIPLATNSTIDALDNLQSSVNQSGQLLLTAQFKLASSTKIKVTLFVLFPTEA
jgi:hypothetical protein